MVWSIIFSLVLIHTQNALVIATKMGFMSGSKLFCLPLNNSDLLVGVGVGIEGGGARLTIDFTEIMLFSLSEMFTKELIFFLVTY